jgi:hypothetical protein
MGAPPAPAPDPPPGGWAGANIGATDLPAVSDWYDKVEVWRTKIAGMCGTKNVPPAEPETPGVLGGLSNPASGLSQGLGNLAHSLESVAFIATLGVGLWFFWPILVGAKKAGI